MCPTVDLFSMSCNKKYEVAEILEGSSSRAWFRIVEQEMGGAGGGRRREFVAFAAPGPTSSVLGHSNERVELFSLGGEGVTTNLPEGSILQEGDYNSPFGWSSLVEQCSFITRKPFSKYWV